MSKLKEPCYLDKYETRPEWVGVKWVFFGTAGKNKVYLIAPCGSRKRVTKDDLRTLWEIKEEQ